MQLIKQITAYHLFNDPNISTFDDDYFKEYWNSKGVYPSDKEQSSCLVSLKKGCVVSEAPFMERPKPNESYCIYTKTIQYKK